MAKTPEFTNYYTTDEVGRRYRVCIHRGGTVLAVGRKCLAGGREATLNPRGRKGKVLAAKVRKENNL